MSAELSDEGFNYELTEERLSDLMEGGGDTVRELVTEIRAVRAAYAEACAWAWEKDDDPEEWQRWAYRSGKPDWFTLPDWFLEKYPWMRRPQ